MFGNSLLSTELQAQPQSTVERLEFQVSSLEFRVWGPLASHIVNPIKLETGLWPNSAGIPYKLILRIEAIGFPTFGLLL